MEKKKLVINAAICDARTVTEEYLNSYESIEIHAALLLVSKNSKELLSRYNIRMNVSQTIEVSEDTDLVTQNGSFEISEGTIMSKPTLLMVNGHLEINKNSEEALKSFVGFVVNGSVSYPDDLGNCLPPININGTAEAYPADAIRLKKKLILDKSFIIRAKNAKYYVKNKVIIADETLDISSLAAKHTTFITKKAIIAENLLESAARLFSDDTEIIVIPAGYAYVQEDTLDELMIKKYGDKLFVDGDLIIQSESENALNKLSGLRVNGTVMILKRLADRLFSLDIEYNDIKYIKGSMIKDKGMLHISRHTLSRYNDGVTVSDCGIVKIDPDITPAEIEEKLQFTDCGMISCRPEQRAAVEIVSEDVGLIKDMDGQGFMDLETDDASLYDKNTQVIKASSYKM